MQTAFLYLGAFGLALSLPVLAAAWLCKQDSHPLLEAVARLRRLPRIVQLFLLAFVAQLIVHGSTKTNSPSALPPGPLGNPPPPLLGDGPAAVFGFTPEQVAAGFVLAHVDPSAGFDFAPPDGITPVAGWLLRGAADDVSPGPSFGPLSDAPAVFAGGRVQDRVRCPSAVYAPLGASLGVVPEANWGLVAGTNVQSMVWCGTTASNSLVVTWRDVLLGRDTSLPVSVQAELFDDGNFAYRYDLRNVKCRIDSGELEVEALSNVVVGASLGGQPQNTTLYEVATNAPFSVFQSPFTVSFQALDAADALVGDRDADGLSTFDEIFVHRTDPGLAVRSRVRRRHERACRLQALGQLRRDVARRGDQPRLRADRQDRPPAGLAAVLPFVKAGRGGRMVARGPCAGVGGLRRGVGSRDRLARRRQHVPSSFHEQSVLGDVPPSGDVCEPAVR